MTTFSDYEVACPNCGRQFWAFYCASMFLIGDPEADRREREMVEEITRNECPGCGKRVPDEVVAAADD